MRWPTASIAFIDEIFKANSAILNALLTLLNEREFDHGRGRIRTPLVSVIAASNGVPVEDFLAAFYDRFLLRCEVRPVSEAGFGALLNLPQQPRHVVPAKLTISRVELDQLLAAREEIAVPSEVTAMLADLRHFLQTRDIHLSDRRWRKMLGVLKTAALTNNRESVAVWDLWLTQFCASDQPEQAALVAQWFGSRLGTWKAMNPVRFTHVIEAFEGQLELEQNAKDVAYDDSGKLALAQALGGAERGDVAPRLSSFMRRRFGAAHVRARVGQVDELRHEIESYLRQLDHRMASLAESVADHLWIAPAFAVTGHASAGHAGCRGAAADALRYPPGRLCEPAATGAGHRHSTRAHGRQRLRWPAMFTLTRTRWRPRSRPSTTCHADCGFEALSTVSAACHADCMDWLHCENSSLRACCRRRGRPTGRADLLAPLSFRPLASCASLTTAATAKS